MKPLKLLFAFVVLLVVVCGVALWTLPADFAYRQFAGHFGPVTLSGLQGTVWEGHADGVSVFGRDLGELDWHLDKMPLLRGQALADLRIKGADVDAAGQLQRDGDGRIEARDVRFRLPASLLEPVVDVPALKLLGTVSGSITQATLAGGVLSGASGNARWSEAGVSGQAEARFSDVLAEFASRPDGGIAGTVADDGQGGLEVNGRFGLGLDGFEAEAWLHARGGDERVQEALRYVGEPQPDGGSHLIIRGHLFKLF